MSLHREDYATKVLILFHSMHASIYYAVWYGLYDTLQVICEKMEEYKMHDLVAAEMDYPLGDFTKEIMNSIRKYAESTQKTRDEGGENSDGEVGKTYVTAPM